MDPFRHLSIDLAGIDGVRTWWPCRPSFRCAVWLGLDAAETALARAFTPGVLSVHVSGGREHLGPSLVPAVDPRRAFFNGGHGSLRTAVDRLSSEKSFSLHLVHLRYAGYVVVRLVC